MARTPLQDSKPQKARGLEELQQRAVREGRRLFSLLSPRFYTAPFFFTVGKLVTSDICDVYPAAANWTSDFKILVEQNVKTEATGGLSSLCTPTVAALIFSPLVFLFSPLTKVKTAWLLKRNKHTRAIADALGGFLNVGGEDP